MKKLFLAAALLTMYSTASLAVVIDPGGVTGGGLNTNYTASVSEPAEGGSETLNFTIHGIPANAVVESGTLILCEVGAICTPADSSYSNWLADSVNWSDELIWSGGDGLEFLSDPNTWRDPNFGQGFKIVQEVVNRFGGDGAIYVAAGTDTAGNANHTTWNIVSDVPEPGSLTLLGVALAGFGLIRRRNRRT